ncbi:MAG: hypothetical protein Q7S34_03065 [bacterium]|nr:hypothetical protein [bacterium]
MTMKRNDWETMSMIAISVGLLVAVVGLGCAVRIELVVPTGTWQDYAFVRIMLATVPVGLAFACQSIWFLSRAQAISL